MTYGYISCMNGFLVMSVSRKHALQWVSRHGKNVSSVAMSQKHGTEKIQNSQSGIIWCPDGQVIYKLLMFDNSYWPSCIWVTEGLIHWGRVTHICVCKLAIIASHNGLSPGRRQAIIWTNAAELLIRALGTNFSEFLSEIYAFSFKKKHLKMSSAKWRPFCLGLNELMLSRWTLKSHTSWISCLWLKKRAVIKWGFVMR